MDQGWKSPDIRAAEAELDAAIESADKIVADAVRAANAAVAGEAAAEQPARRDERDDGGDTFLHDAW